MSTSHLLTPYIDRCSADKHADGPGRNPQEAAQAVLQVAVNRRAGSAIACSLGRKSPLVHRALNRYVALGVYIARHMNSRCTGQAGGSGITSGTPLSAMSALPPTSARLRRAAAAEREELERHKERLLARRAELREELDQLERALMATDDRITMVSEIAGNQAAAKTPATEVAADRTMLRGTQIREAAVRVLAARPEGSGAIHYRRWFELLEQSGYAVAGKDPLATFLTQISRSPVVRRSSQQGVYELDRSAPEGLRRRLSRLQAELREATAAPSTADLREVRARREEINASIAQTERALEEAARVLGEASPVTAVAG